MAVGDTGSLRITLRTELLAAEDCVLDAVW
jgi:hypothetical protein